jgi:heterodisulfide reductase subunit A
MTAPNEFNRGFNNRAAIYIKYSQAVPLAYTIDRDLCIGCGLCEKMCLAEAIRYDEEPRRTELEAGAVVLAVGNVPFDPRGLDVYGYAKFPNVITSMEFERFLSATGHTEGHIQRASDLKEPQKIAWLQCIGSRDTHECSHPYCSSVCCMYAIKEAVIAKEHSVHPLDTAIFFMDMRTYGKEFEKYYNRAKEEEGIRFVRCRVHSVDEDRETNDLHIRYVDEGGNIQVETFDMVVLSVGLETPKGLVELAKRLDIDLDKDNFVETRTFTPVETSRKGVYVCGTFLEPKDIPFSVMEASAAACGAKEVLSDVRGTLVKEKTYPEETDVFGQESRTGVFVCNCGINIGGIVDVPAVTEYARTLPGVVYAEHNLFTCSQDTQEKITEVIKREGLNRVVVASCTPKTHEPMFQETLMNAGLNKYLFEMANIRNQCSWVHGNEPEVATEKAKDLVRMAVARAQLIESLPQPTVSVDHNALVIGGGVSGMTAALALADQGFHTYLVEQSNELGGNALKLIDTWRGEEISGRIKEMVKQLKDHSLVDVYTGANIKEATGFIGNFETTISQNGTDIKMEHGILVVAVGAEEYKPSEYLYGEDDRVLTALDLDSAIRSKEERIAKAKTAVFIQCVGSREPERPYCSKVCCTHTMKSALQLKEINPEMGIYVLYRDIRTYGQREELYREARNRGVIFIRYDLEQKPEVKKNGDGISVAVKDPILGRDIEISPDFIVLASAIVPRDNAPLAQMYKLALQEEGFFMEAHAKLAPVDSATGGIFLAGMAHYPKPVEESIAQAKAAASRASVVLSKDKLTIEGVISNVNELMCRGCGKCEDVCPFGAIAVTEREDGKRAAYVQGALCKGCGACAVACPTGAAALCHFTDNQVLTMVEAALAM